MRMDHAIFRRPAFWLATTIFVLALPVLAACGTAAQPEPAAPAPDEEIGASTGQSAAQSADQPAAETASTESMSGHTGHGEQGSAGPVVPADAVMINLPIVARSTTLTRDDLRVSQGDTVRLTFTSDEPGEVHLHGYDLTAPVSPEHPGELEFKATTAGAFGINFHVFAAGNITGSGSDHHATAPKTVVSETPVSVAITAEPDADGGVNVQIATQGFRFAPDLVDQPHTPGAGHAHIYVDGVKLGRVFNASYRIDPLAPGQHEIRVTLNTNDHSDLVFDGKNVEATATVVVPDVGQGHGDSHSGHDHGDHNHGADSEIVAEVHLGNLEVYP
ncbi:MAG: hypothetical protein OXI54_04515 [Chloroflexota bacterium]|nr:hypothetical protein [Chloroflexota bacterium]MDE2683392.1 hypothetical protein [Chloroflexota bacterium]